VLPTSAVLASLTDTFIDKARGATKLRGMTHGFDRIIESLVQKE
jgi:hypothetical protein